MTEKQARDLLAKEKKEVTAQAEQTRPGRVFTPEVDILEKETEIVILADMPGVDAERLTVDLRENVLTIEGDAAPPEAGDESDVLREYYTGKYYRQFSLSDAIDQTRIEAVLSDGVMRLVLPKVEKLKPRKIEVRAA